MGQIRSPFVSFPFVIALYYGQHKPTNLDFLNDFVDEYDVLRPNGLTFSGHTFSIIVSAVVCDAPARALVKNIKGHGGYSGCEWCVQTGEWKGKMTFPDMKSQHRADENFEKMLGDDHHLGPSPLTGKGIGMVSQFVLDYMHLVCLGIVR